MNYFNLFSNVLITRGVGRILISDLQRDKSELFPIEFIEIINDLSEKSIESVIESYDLSSQEFVREYIDILLQNEFGFITKNDWDKNFSSLTYEYSVPNKITNAFLEIDNLEILNKICSSLSNLGTQHIVIHYNKILTIEDFKFVEDSFRTTTITSIEIFSLYYDEINEIFFNTLEKYCSRVFSLVFYNCRKTIYKPKDRYKFTTSFTKKHIEMNSCGKVDVKYFNTNITKVLEAINHNSCLYKKIGIDKEGNIKNCPAMNQCFGNIKEVTLDSAINHKDFKKYWNISKDSITICKDCEFRYVCTDCRAYTERSHISQEGLDVSKPLKCGYSPNTGKWEEWSTNPLKKKAIQFYGMQNLTKI